MKGDLYNVYYIPEIRHRLTSVGKLFSQGWEPRLNRNRFTLYDTKERMIAQATFPERRIPTHLTDDLPRFRSSCECE